MSQQKIEVKKHFDAWSRTYEQEIWIRDRYFHNHVKKLVLRSISNDQMLKILELGTGTGVYLEEFIRCTHYIIGMDISIEMLKISKEKMREHGYNSFDLILADIESLPFRDKSFDVINCIEVIRHLPRPYKQLWEVFNEFKRIITIKGSVLITLPNILFPLNVFSIIYYIIPLKILKIFNKKVGFHYGQSKSFPHFPVLYNEPEDHMYNLLFIKKLSRNRRLKISWLKGIFFFPSCPKILSSIFRKLDEVLGTSIWAFLAYSFLIKLNRL